jgi:hypothetical protein
MGFELDRLHAAFIRRARQNAVRTSSLALHTGGGSRRPNQLSATSLAPSADNGTAGQYYCVYEGHVFPRVEQLEAEAVDLERDNLDSNGNPPCGNEVFQDLEHFACGCDWDMPGTHADGVYVRRFAAFFLQCVEEVIEGPLPRAAQMVITTTVNDRFELTPYRQRQMECPFCRGEVVQRNQRSQMLQGRDARSELEEYVRTTYACKMCGTKWLHESSRPDTFTLQVRGKHARMKESVDTRPETVDKCKTGVHFRLQGVLVSQSTNLAILMALRKKSYAFDRSVPPSTWDDVIDLGPAEKNMMRKVLHRKADICRACRGKCKTKNQFMETVTCSLCCGSGRNVHMDKRYQVFDVLFAESGKFLTELAAEDPGRFAPVLERHRSDIPFIVKLCSMAVPVPGAQVVEIANDSLHSVPVDTFDRTATGKLRAVSVLQRNWNKSRKRAFRFLDPRLYVLLFGLISRHQPRFAQYAALKEAFYCTANQKSIIAHLCGDGSTFCENRFRHDIQKAADHFAGNVANVPPQVVSTLGYHSTNSSWVKITPRGLSFHCFSKNAACGCDKWRGSRRYPITAAEASVLFPIVDDAEVAAEMNGTQHFAKTSQFARQFRSTKVCRTFMRRLVDKMDLLNSTARFCAATKHITIAEPGHFLKFYDENSFKVETSSNRPDRGGAAHMHHLDSAARRIMDNSKRRRDMRISARRTKRIRRNERRA